MNLAERIKILDSMIERIILSGNINEEYHELIEQRKELEEWF